jgi:hypothetical protein
MSNACAKTAGMKRLDGIVLSASTLIALFIQEIGARNIQGDMSSSSY